MKRPQLLIGLAILLVVIVISAILRLTKPEAEKKVATKTLPVVEVISVEPETVDLTLPSQGVVEPDKASLLASQVSGKVIWVSDSFKAGWEFKKGDELVHIEDSDFQAALAQAKATVADAKLSLATEEARQEQSLRDWKALGKGGEPPELVARKPHVESAKAHLDSAIASAAQAERNLERTRITAPYDLRVEEIHTEVGSFLNVGSPVANVYDVTAIEVRLPLSLDDYAFLSADSKADHPKVALLAEIAGQKFQWDAEIVRSERQVDRNSRSVYVVARLEPEGDEKLQPGLFVKAEVQGRTLENVYRVPLEAFKDLVTVVVVDANNRLAFREVNVAKRQEDEALVIEGLNAGERILITSLDVVEGMEVEVKDDVVKEEPAEETTTKEGENPPKT